MTIQPIKTSACEVWITSSQSDLKKLQYIVQLTIFDDCLWNTLPPLSFFHMKGLWINAGGKKEWGRRVKVTS